MGYAPDGMARADNKKRTKPKRRRWLKWLLGVAVGVVVLTLAMPVWLPWVVVPILRGQGVAVESFERRGADFLELNTIRFSNESAVLEIDRLKIQLPHRWLLDRFARSPARDAAQIELSDWTVELQSSEAATTNTASTNSLHGSLDLAMESLKMARPWLRRISALNGRVTLQDFAVEIPRIAIVGDSVTAGFSISNLTSAGEMVLDFKQTNAFRLTTVLPDRVLTNSIFLRRGATNWRFSGRVEWRDNVAELDGGFPENDWLPESVAVSGTNWNVAAETIGLEGYQALTGSFQAGWTNAHYEFQINGGALPSVDNALIPDSIAIDIAGQGTLESIAIETLNISTPALLAQLSGPLAIDFGGRMLVPETTLKVTAEFIPEDRLPFTGLLEGTVTARPDADEIVNADFQVQMHAFDGFGLSLDELNLNGAIHWPQMVVSNCTFTFPGAGTFAIAGELDLLTQVTTNFAWTFNGSVPTNMLPANLGIGGLNADGEFAGAWPELTHRTRVTATSVDWSGSRLDTAVIEVGGNVLRTNDWSLELGYDVAGLTATGSIDLGALSDSRLTAELISVEATTSEKTTIRLEKPAAFSVVWSGRETTNAVPPFAFSIEPVHLSGGGRDVRLGADVNWPLSGMVSISATNLRSADLSGILSAALPEINLRELEMNASWDAGPVSFSTRLNGDWRLPDIGLVDLNFGAAGDDGGIEISPSQIGFNGEPLVAVDGRIPVRLEVQTGVPKYAWNEDGMFDARLSMEANESFWDEVADRSTIRFGQPSLELTATGDLEHFHATMNFEATSVRSQVVTNLPTGYSAISNLVIRASASRDGAEISEGRFTVVGQPAHFDARIPFEAADWEEWFDGLKTLDWRNASGRFQIPTIDVAAFDSVAGEFIRPVGRAAVDVRLKIGGLVGGGITFTNLASRTIEPLGSVRNIQGEIKLDGQRTELKKVQATVGGQTVRVAGGAGWADGALSDVDLSLIATNVTLIRSVDLFLRGDLDLKIQSEGPAPAKISGEVSLHNSLLFQDIGNAMAIDLNQPAKRPPFFSVPQAPFADWQLDVRVRGKKFLRVISPVFKGSVSTGLQLGGTLKEPVALGEVSIESGQILFPFGTLDVSRGAVQLTRQNPHQPKIDFSGQGMNFGYNIGINVTGFADAPNIVFNSVPPLTTREIMLMLTAGEIPSGDYSYTDVDKASKLGYFLGKELINQLVGMDTGESKLLFRTGEYVTDDGQLTYRIEYRLVNWLSLFGEYTRFRDYNGGLKFNIFSR